MIKSACLYAVPGILLDHEKCGTAWLDSWHKTTEIAHALTLNIFTRGRTHRRSSEHQWRLRLAIKLLFIRRLASRLAHSFRSREISLHWQPPSWTREGRLWNGLWSHSTQRTSSNKDGRWRRNQGTGQASSRDNSAWEVQVNAHSPLSGIQHCWNQAVALHGAHEGWQSVSSTTSKRWVSVVQQVSPVRKTVSWDQSRFEAAY